jgi:hypothetical protein
MLIRKISCNYNTLDFIAKGVERMRRRKVKRQRRRAKKQRRNKQNE